VHIAMIGTRGVPARYGGFETCVEEVGWRLVDRGHEVTVYCRTTRGETLPSHFRGMRLVQLPAIRHRALETLSHTGLSIASLSLGRAPDAAFVFNAANAPWLPALRSRGVPVATHVDGLEWKRGKWGPRAQRYYRAAESMAVRWSDALIADAEGIADYYDEEFGAPTELITYGAPRVDAKPDGVAALGLEPGGYHLVVARFEPENHVEEIVRGYTASASSLPLVVVGSAPYSHRYIAAVEAAADERVRFLGSLWDQDLLDQLYANCLTYWHGHSVGGTNPSLLRAIGAGAPTNAYDVGFNREVLRDSGRYWSTPDDISRLVLASEADRPLLRHRGSLAREESRRYDWDDVADGYEDLARRLAAGYTMRQTMTTVRRAPARRGADV
jgi:glycosyltransferase involved in cell wall biosynthesis